MSKCKPAWVCNLYRICFAGLCFDGLVHATLAIWHPTAVIVSIISFGLAAMCIVAAGDLTLKSATVLLGLTKPGRKAG
jgi:hypothetical protein